MIKYRYLPFTHGKPRYQTLDSDKWQLKAQSLPASSSIVAADSVTPIPASVAVVAEQNEAAKETQIPSQILTVI